MWCVCDSDRFLNHDKSPGSVTSVTQPCMTQKMAASQSNAAAHESLGFKCTIIVSRRITGIQPIGTELQQ